MCSLGPSEAQEKTLEDQNTDVTYHQIFENVVSKLEAEYFDQQFRTKRLPAIVKSLRGKAKQALTISQQRQVSHDLLSRLPVSHTGMLSKEAYTRLVHELANKALPGFGFQVIRLDGMYFANAILEGGPADLAGLNAGDRILR